jgi:hypothetical protein
MSLSVRSLRFEVCGFVVGGGLLDQIPSFTILEDASNSTKRQTSNVKP